MYVNIETERLILRPLKLADSGFILDLLNSEGWLQFIGDRNVKNTMDAENYIRKILDNNNFFYNVFELKETGQPIGIITFLYRDAHKYPDIGFAMLPAFEKNGFAFEASNAYLNQIKKEKELDKIIAITLPDNTNSINLVKKLGLEYESKHTEGSEVLHIYSSTFKNS